MANPHRLEELRVLINRNMPGIPARLPAPALDQIAFLFHTFSDGQLRSVLSLDGQLDAERLCQDYCRWLADGLRSHVFSRLLGIDQVSPTRAAKYIGTEGQLVFEIVFLHDPGCAQAAPVEIILKIILLQHDFFQHLRESITTGVGRVPVCFGDGNGLWVEEVSDPGITADQTEVTVAVRDHGRGLPRTDLDRVFDKFYRSDGSDAQLAYGYGLGLYVCRRLIETHGGRIWAENAADGGAIFSFTLPVAG